jgi:glycosyltransferase involved in cell wall biosynthesis
LRSQPTVPKKRRQPSDPIDVCVDATSWTNDRGFGRFTREIVAALAARDGGFRYTLLFDGPPPDGVPGGVAVASVATRRTLAESTAGASTRSLPYLWKMARLAQATKFDVFFFPTLYSYFPLFANVPCVVCYHDATAERLPRLLFPTRLNRGLWRAKAALARLQTTRAMTVSQSSAADLENILRFPRSRIDVVTEAADPVFRVIADPGLPDEERARHGIPSEATLLVHVGGMNAHKNVLGLLRAMPAIVAAHPEVQLAIVGDASGKGFWDDVATLERFVAEHPPLPSHVHFTGYIDDESLCRLLNSTYALVFPSLWEGFGLPAVEAMSCAVPVLASRRGSLPEVVGDAGLYFDPEDPAAIAASALRLLDDPALRERLSGIAHARSQGFRWDRAAELAEFSFRRALDDRLR